ncbi:MAG: class I SAM-dependent methyltransferase [Anaerolineales bacterium]|nr:class I SAM-dependent methyltransferase [Anaerolineales bacterium]
MSESLPSLYFDLADWWPMLSSPEDYAGEAAIYHRVLVEACAVSPIEVLELGSGGGNNALHLKTHFKLTLVDLSPQMLAVSQRLNPECEHIQGDMRTVRLGRQFDAVFVHDAVSYLTSEDDLLAAMTTVFVHCRPGGAALFCPDETLETFHPYTRNGGHDTSDGSGRGLRYVEWVRDPNPGDGRYVMEMGICCCTATARCRPSTTGYRSAVFSCGTWLRLLAEAGFSTPELIIHEDEEFWDPGGGELFVDSNHSSTAKFQASEGDTLHWRGADGGYTVFATNPIRSHFSYGGRL